VPRHGVRYGPTCGKILHCVDEVTATPAITPLSQIWEIGIAFNHELPAGPAEGPVNLAGASVPTAGKQVEISRYLFCEPNPHPHIAGS
jgi:hypothetical protein